MNEISAIEYLENELSIACRELQESFVTIKRLRNIIETREKSLSVMANDLVEVLTLIDESDHASARELVIHALENFSNQKV